ncbi:PAS domain-containing protein [Mariniflexile ostreae]|uniref:histidine kinase n=1 Tax=Mariniflexile ostreae TaxID=1520892 RepID=A0ABV5FA38_9FLAO
MDTNKTKHIFLERGAEMGKLIRAKDWSKTSLGDPITWPQSLQTMVSVMLNNPFGMYIAWGKDYTQIYNDGFCPILGSNKHPQALGKSSQETFSEIWHIIGPMFANVMKGEAICHEDFIVPLNRNGKTEDSSFDFAYSPIRLASGEVGGILVTIKETTIKKQAEKNELEFVIDAAQLGTFDYNPLTNKFLGNERLKSWFGLLPEDSIELTHAIDAIIEKDRNRLIETIKSALEYASGGTYEIEYTIINAVSNKEIILHAKGKVWFNEEHIAYRLNGTLEDVTNHVLARKKIEESEQNIRALVENAPFPIGVYVGKDMRIALANKSIMDAWGKGYDMVGKLYSDILPEFGNQDIFNQIRAVLCTGKPFHAKNQHIDIMIKGGLKRHYFNYSFIPLKDASGNIVSVLNTAADVTELTEAKQKVEESERRFRDVVKQAPLGITILRGFENIIEMANESYLQIIDHTEEQFVGKPLFDTLPETKEVMGPIIADIYKTGNAFYGYEFPVILNRRGKTETGYYNFVYHPLKEDNAISGIMVIATEVTAMVKAKHIIEENEEKLNLIIEASELGVFDVNLKTNDIVVSDRCYEILGFSPEADLTHEDLVTHIHPDDLPIRKEAFEKAFVTGTLRYQSRVLWEDHSTRWIDAKGKVFFDENHVPERLLGTVRDITEEKNFQQQLLDREEKFSLLADSIPQQVWTADPEGNLNYFNQTVLDYSGFTLKHLTNNGWLDMVHPEDRAENIKQWTQSIRTGEDFLIEHRFRKHNGDYRWQLSRAVPQKDPSGTIKMWVGSSTDIQEQKMFTTELENMVKMRTNELQQKNIDLEKMNKELQSFVYISSHDLQEPLRKIQTFSSRIIETEYATLSDTGKRHFSRMQKSAHRMQNLIQDLIAYSRTNVQEIKFEVIEFIDIIEDVKETLSEELEQNDVTFKLTNLCAIKVIPVQFKQVMLNLISNSIKFVKTGHAVTIEINSENIKGHKTGIETLSDNKNYCHIRFSDNGIGFEQQYNKKIFEVFQRLHNKEDYAGTGIGLAIVKRIIENHEGAIVATSEHNEGAVFDIYIPAP